MSLAFWEVNEWVVVPGTVYPPIPTTYDKIDRRSLFRLDMVWKRGERFKPFPTLEAARFTL